MDEKDSTPSSERSNYELEEDTDSKYFNIGSQKVSPSIVRKLSRDVNSSLVKNTSSAVLVNESNRRLSNNSDDIKVGDYIHTSECEVNEIES